MTIRELLVWTAGYLEKRQFPTVAENFRAALWELEHLPFADLNPDVLDRPISNEAYRQTSGVHPVHAEAKP